MSEENLYHFNDYYCLACECGCTKFNLLKSSKIECSDCSTIINKRWVTCVEIKKEHEVHL